MEKPKPQFSATGDRMRATILRDRNMTMLKRNPAVLSLLLGLLPSGVAAFVLPRLTTRAGVSSVTFLSNS